MATDEQRNPRFFRPRASSERILRRAAVAGRMKPAHLRQELGWKSGATHETHCRRPPHFCTACRFWDTGLNACCLGSELKLPLPEVVQRHELMAFDQSGGVVAIAERSLRACRAMSHKPFFKKRRLT